MHRGHSITSIRINLKHFMSQGFDVTSMWSRDSQWNHVGDGPMDFQHSRCCAFFRKLNYCMGHEWVPINSVNKTTIKPNLRSTRAHTGAASTETFKFSCIRSHSHLISFINLYLFGFFFHVVLLGFNKVPRKMPQFICIFVNLKLNLIEFIARKSQ